MRGFFGGGCMVFFWGGLGGWFFLGGCVVFSGGVRGFSGGRAWFFGGGGCVWFFGGACVVLSGGEACVVFFVFSGCIGYNELRSMSGRYASYWNAFLF